MRISPKHTYFGFGFGAIQAGLFLYEAYQSGNFNRYVVSEVDQEIINHVRGEGGYININIAYEDHREAIRFGPIEILNPGQASEQELIIDAIAEASEIATAVPSVDVYATGHCSSIDHLLSEGLVKKIKEHGSVCVIYTAENNNQAAEILERLVIEKIKNSPENKSLRNHAQFLNTVIGKMCHRIVLKEANDKFDLVPIVPNSHLAVLVEAFNAILISKIKYDPSFQRGIEVFNEVDSLLPYEEAKLFGHNAVHALLGYLGACMGVKMMATMREYPELMQFAYSAFVDEIGYSLCEKYAGFGELFTINGFKSYASDLLERMTHPLLMDRIERSTRDVERKLGWDDRFIGGIRLCLNYKIMPVKLAFGAVAAIYEACGRRSDLLWQKLKTMRSEWEQSTDQHGEIENVLSCINGAIEQFLKWKKADFSVDSL